jgi:hypothetical protein
MRFHFWRTLGQTVCASWTHLAGLVKSQARDSYSRDLCLAHRMPYAHVYLMARLWYVAQVLSAPRQCLQQITAAVTYFIWRGTTFRVPVSTLQFRQKEDGWELLDIAAKCRALLLSRMYVQGARPGIVMVVGFHKLGLNDRITKPPIATAYPNGLEHLRSYAIDMAYVLPPRSDDTPKL